mgnify:CR=1 FL=1
MTLPMFKYHPDPVATGAVIESGDACACCGKARGFIYEGAVYGEKDIGGSLCPWCIADGSARDKFGASFFDGDFCDENLESIHLTDEAYRAVFGCTIGFATFNPIGWWVHCGEPAEYVTRNEPYDMLFECRRCGEQHVIQDLD